MSQTVPTVPLVGKVILIVKHWVRSETIRYWPYLNIQSKENEEVHVGSSQSALLRLYFKTWSPLIAPSI